jgi:hypothetical protein
MSFTLRAVPGTERAGYHPDEVARRPTKYDCPETRLAEGSPEWRSYDGAERCGIEREVQIAVAGGERFTIRAECNSPGCTIAHEVGPITAKRRAWILPVFMLCANNQRQYLNLTRFVNYGFDEDHPDRGLYLVFNQLPRQEISVVHYHYASAEDQIRRDLDRVYGDSGAPAKEPHVMVIVFGASIAEIGEHVHTSSESLHRTRNRGNHIVQLTRPLWYNMGGPGAEWFVRGRFYSSLGNVTITRDMRLTPYPLGSDRRDQIQLNVGSIFNELDRINGRHIGNGVSGRLEVRVRVPYFSYGYTYCENIIYMATEMGWGRVIPDDALINTLRHEFGHTIRLTPDTDVAWNRGLNRVPTSYTGRRHSGEHCCYNIPDPQPSAYTYTHTQQARCNMYGAGDDTTTRNTMVYCPECKRSARLLDLSPGWR